MNGNRTASGNSSRERSTTDGDSTDACLETEIFVGEVHVPKAGAGSRDARAANDVAVRPVRQRGRESCSPSSVNVVDCNEAEGALRISC